MKDDTGMTSLEEQIAIQPEICYVPEFDPEGPDGNIRAFTFENVPFEGKRTKVFGYIGFPLEASEEKPVPAMLLIHGGGGHAFACWVRQWNARGFAALAFDTTGYMPLEPNAGDQCYRISDRWERTLQGVFAQESFVPAPDNTELADIDRPLGDQWLFHALSGAIRAHTFLREQPRVDSSRVGVTGISWGGVITSLLIGYDPRFAFAIPVYGSGYLGESSGIVCNFFKSPSVRDLWLAEKRFHRVRIPVLLLAWNNDSCFSVQGPSLSYQDLAARNEGTRLCLKHELLHSQMRGCTPAEVYAFAQSQIGEIPEFPKLSLQRDGRQIKVLPFCEGDMTVDCAILYYLEEEQKENACWKTFFCEGPDPAFTAVLPPEATGYYVEVSFCVKGVMLQVSTAFESLSDTDRSRVSPDAL